MTALWAFAFVIAIWIAYRVGVQDGKRLGATAEPPALAAERARELRAAEAEVNGLLGEAVTSTAPRLPVAHPRLRPAQCMAIRSLLREGWDGAVIAHLALYELEPPTTTHGATISHWDGTRNLVTGARGRRGDWAPREKLTEASWVWLQQVLQQRPRSRREFVFLYANRRPVTLADVLLCAALPLEDPAAGPVD